MTPKYLLLPLTALLLAAALPAAESAPDDARILKQAGVPTDGAGLLDFFRKRTPTDDDIRALVKKLDDDDFEVREKATRDLVLLGPPAEAQLREASKSADAEVKRRADECLRKIGAGPSATVIAAAARALARARPAGAAEVLLAYAPKVEGQATADDVRAALAALAVRDGKPDPALVAALADKAPGKRAAAAVAFARAKEQLPAVRKLLHDPEPSVRLQTALALAALREKEAVPALIDLIPDLTRTQFSPVEDLLYQLAGDKAPNAVPGEDAAARKKARDAWAAWWAKEGAGVDLAKLDATTRFLNYTMVVLLDAGRVLEVDGDNKPRWSIDGLQQPLDAQLLPGGERVLVAEHDGNRVTERTLKGEIVWKKDIEGPLVAQRLRNGNTFIGTRVQLLEVDRAGRTVFTHFRRQGDTIMRAQKARNGEIGLVTNAGLFLRLDASGKELSKFSVDVRTFGGRVDLLPNGHVLVPLMDENRVVEYDAGGEVVWQAAYPQPVAAVRLPNGQTVVTSMQARRAAALDEKGAEVWHYDAGARLTRAWRR